MKILFLDFNGVICVQESPWDTFDKMCCDNVQRILDATGAKIVVTSSWRLDYDIKSLKELMARGYEAPIPVAFKGNIGTFNPEVILDKAPTAPFTKTVDQEIVGRGLEITMWLKEHPEVTQYCVLDDYTYDLVPHQAHLVVTNCFKGVSEENVIKAIDILNGDVG